MADTGLHPLEWTQRWKTSKLEDTAENMRFTLRALALLLDERSGRRGGYGYGYGYDYTPAKPEPPPDAPVSPNGATAPEAPPVSSPGG